MLLTKIGSHKKKIGSLAQVKKKVMKKNWGGGVNLPHPKLNRIKGSFCSPEKKFSTNFSKANTKFCLSLHHNCDNSYLFVNGKIKFKFKTDRKMLTFQLSFV